MKEPAEDLGERALAAVRDLLEAHKGEGDLDERARLNDCIVQLCELLDLYDRFSELRRLPIRKRPTQVQLLAMWQAMCSPELKPFTRAAQALGAADRKNGGKFSLRRVVGEAGYAGRQSFDNIRKRYGYDLRAWLRASYERGQQEGLTAADSQSRQEPARN